ncbi:MAG: choice-of-anchor E domain-containing protein [Fimbriimonas sp.]
MNTQRILISLVVLSGSVVSRAGVITYSQAVPLTVTDWDATISLPKFDGSLGKLTSVSFLLRGTVIGDAQFENKSKNAANVTLEFDSLISLTAPDGTLLITTLPLFSKTENVAKYDGVFDFGGTSGRTYAGLSAEKTVTSSGTTSYNSIFEGAGSIDLDVSSVSTSKATGPGNLASSFDTLSAAYAEVTYNYENPVPEPASMAALGFGAFAFFRRKKKNSN